MHDRRTTALLLIDVQRAFDEPGWGQRNNPAAETRMRQLLAAWRQPDGPGPVIHIRHESTDPASPLHPGRPGVRFKAGFAPSSGETVFAKSVNSAFIGTRLEAHLRAQHIGTLVIAGLTTDHCVSTTTRMAGNLGFDTLLVADATATFDRRDRNGKNHPAETVHELHLASLDGEFCAVRDTEDVLAAFAAKRA